MTQTVPDISPLMPMHQDPLLVYTLRFNNDVDFLYRLATVLEMRLNHEYWCQPECAWQTNSINKTATSERLDSWTSRLWRGTGIIELVFKSLDCFTVRPIFSNRPITRINSFSFFFFFLFGGGGGGMCVLSSNAFTSWCCIPISRPPRVIKTFQTSLLLTVPIIRSSWNFQELLPMTKVMSMQKVKVRGQRSRSQRSWPHLAVSGL